MMPGFDSDDDEIRPDRGKRARRQLEAVEDPVLLALEDATDREEDRRTAAEAARGPTRTPNNSRRRAAARGLARGAPAANSTEVRRAGQAKKPRTGTWSDA